MSRSGRWKPPDPQLRRIRLDVEGKLLAGQLRRSIPGQRGYAHRRGDVKYELGLYRVLATGEVVCNISVTNFEQFADGPYDAAVIRWMCGPGRDLVAKVDRIVDRPSFQPVPLGGRTLLIAEFGLEQERGTPGVPHKADYFMR